MSPTDDLLSDERRDIDRERGRVQEAYRRRQEWEVRSDLYAPWSPASILATAERKRLAALMLHEAGAFPRRGARCLEVGCGVRGWLGELIDWGVTEGDLHGIDVNADRAAEARTVLPSADVRVGDAAALPWADDTFKLVIASTLFTSILDPTVRRLVAREIIRVLAPGGALLWYDFAVNNPRNSDVRKVTCAELRELFPALGGSIQSCTLAPPLARLVTSRRRWSWALASCLETIPLLRTHLLAVLVKTTNAATTRSDA